MTSNIVISIDYSRVLANTIGINEDTLPTFLKGTSLTSTRFLESEDYINWADQHRIIQNAIDLFDQEGLGVIAGSYYPLASHGAMGSAAMSSPTVREAIRVFLKYYGMRAQFTNLTSEIDGNSFKMIQTLLVENDSVGQFLIEALIVSTKLSFDFLSGRPQTDVEVYCSFEKPSYSTLLESTLKCPVHYNQPQTLFSFPNAYLDMPVATRNEAIRQFSEQQCESLNKSIQQPDKFSEKISALLRQLPGRQVTQAQTAQLLNVSPRTLLRRLKEENIRYQMLHDAEQKKLALHYLEQPHITLESISESMGYHDSSSFRRAFKRWFGVPPSEYKHSNGSLS